MVQLRVLSWNIRTLGTHKPSDEKIARLAEVIHGSSADIVCIQELMLGGGVGPRLNDSISQASIDVISAIRLRLRGIDDGASWRFAVSGASAVDGGRMRDAYGFLWKATPSSSDFTPGAPASRIRMITPPVVLTAPKMRVAGRRPGMITFAVKSGGNWFPVNIFSYHAPTPVNTWGKMSAGGAGWAVIDQALLPPVGGTYAEYGRDQYKWRSVGPLPKLDTWFVGDFNYSMDQPWAGDVYTNFLGNYQGCVSTPGDVKLTTYSPNPNEQGRLISAYDNVFALRSHTTFVQTFTPGESEAINFIADSTNEYGEFFGFQDDDNGEESAKAWYEVHGLEYARQHAVPGLSDHLPVWTTFTFDQRTGVSAHPVATSNVDGNSLLHALNGLAVDGLLVDPAAAASRTNFANTFGQLDELPSQTPVRTYLLQALQGETALQPSLRQKVEQALKSTRCKLLPSDFRKAIALYTTGLRGGRPFGLSDVALFAYWKGWIIQVHHGADEQTYNPDGEEEAPYAVYFQGRDFARWEA